MNAASRFEELPRAIGRLTPDAITAAGLMLVLLAAAALGLGNSPEKVLDAWYRGLWMLLPFTMQMTLVLVLSGVVGQSNHFRTLVRRLAQWPRTTNQTICGTALVSGVLSYFNWGLGMVLGPIAGIYFAREAERKGIRVDFLFLLAVLWGAGATWQFGLSASAPLLVATPGHVLEKEIGVMPLSTTIFSPAAILLEVLYMAAVMIVGCWMHPRKVRQLSEFPEASAFADATEPPVPPQQEFAERLERHPFMAWTLAAMLAAWLCAHFVIRRASLDINSLNASFLFLGFILHGNIHRFSKALEKAVASAWPVVLIYHLYAGVAGLVQFTTVGERFARLLASFSAPYTFPFLAALSASVVSMFVPSSGGQWAIQGFVTAKVAVATGVTVQRGLLAMSVGDHMGNLLSPFWYMVVAGVARVNFREFIGYGLVFAALWFVLGVAVFTFAPC
ncbi:MAG: short-chain fatty acid transporter [Acidobacteria bacterium]|nr:short-chain fatty acid transporter [Acidobacteriota bacterium]